MVSWEYKWTIFHWHHWLVTAGGASFYIHEYNKDASYDWSGSTALWWLLATFGVWKFWTWKNPDKTYLVVRGQHCQGQAEWSRMLLWTKKGRPSFEWGGETSQTSADHLIEIILKQDVLAWYIKCYHDSSALKKISNQIWKHVSRKTKPLRTIFSSVDSVPSIYSSPAGWQRSASFVETIIDGFPIDCIC